MRAFILLTLVLTGCPRPVPPPSPDLTTATQIPACGSTAPTPDDVCDGLFTTEGLACVRCPGAVGCIDTIDRIYCVAGTCLDDVRCRLEAPDVPDAGTSGHRRKR